MFNVSSNPRVNESMNLICNAFLNLAREKNYSAISITEICSRASVARKTFYRNFETKEDIINCILFHKMGEITDKMNATDEPYQTFCCFMNNWKKNLDILRLLDKNDLFGMFNECLSVYIDLLRLQSFAVDKLQNPELLSEYYYRAYAAILSTMLETWTKRNFRDSLEELYKVYRMLLSQH